MNGLREGLRLVVVGVLSALLGAALGWGLYALLS